MKRSIIYCALIEIKPLHGCDLDPAEIAGASVRCYIPAANANCAIEFLIAKLRKMKMALIETEWCVDYENTEWDSPDSQREDSYVAEVRDSGDIAFDTFHAWGHDAPDV